jgi:N-acetylneuraminic acid mutarotase
MAAPRFGHTETLLGNGKVLVAGGLINSVFTASAELYDPVSNTWSDAGSMATARAGATATLLGNGKVLLTGGQDPSGNVLSSAVLYDPASNTWSSAGSMATPRQRHTATLLSNGKVLVAGGAADENNSIPLSSSELYDPVSNTWSSAASLATARDSHTATVLANGKVLVAGGEYGNPSVVLSSAELYDPTSNTWSAAASMASARVDHTATLLTSGKVLVTGGSNRSLGVLSSAELYDPVTNAWSVAGPMAVQRQTPTATLLLDGKVLVAGGNSGSSILSSAELYDPASNTWFPASSMPTARNYQTATLLGDGQVLVVGGFDGNSYLASAELFDPVPTQLVISNVSATRITSHGTITFTVSAEDSAGRTDLGYVGTVQLTSTDNSAQVNSGPLPASYTFVPSDAGTHTFTVTLASLGSQTITLTDQRNSSLTATTSPITVAAGPFYKFVFSVPRGNSVVAGSAFLVTAQATDQFDNPVSESGNITLTATPNDGHGNLPITSVLNGLSTGYFLVNLKTAGSYIFTATANFVSAASNSVTVTPATASFFNVVAPAAATTGTPIPITVTAMDAYGNVATGYAGHVHFTSTDGSAALPGDATLTNGTGVFNVTLNTAGSQSIMVNDTVATRPTITGSSAAITTRGLTVTAFTPTADGFTVTFSKAFDPTKLTLYGPGLATVQDVTLIGAHSGPIVGSVYVDPSNQSITFKATESALQTFFSTPILPDDTYTVTLVSGSSNGFTDGTALLDGANNAGHANYTTTFTTANQSKTILSLPDFARGPDGAHNIQIPNDTGHGIPVTLTNATTVSAATFTLNYNPALLTVTGASSSDATSGGTLTLLGTPTIIDATHATANFQYTSTTPQSGTVVLGDIIATVPNTAAASYKAKELLTLTSITVNGNAFTGVATSAIHANAYFGDVTGNGSIDALDVAFANNVAQGNATGFGAYTLLDPAIIGDVAGDISVDAGDVSTLAAYVSQLPTPRIPAIPTGLTITPTGPDPTLSLAARGGDGESGRGRENAHGPSPTLSATVQLDHPHPKGSTGMTEAVLAVTYDPTAFSVSSADITLGSIPSLGTGWQLSAAIDATTGRIAITLYSTTPISADQPGSLVRITLHPLPGAALPASTVQLVNSVEINGQEYVTQLDDAQGRLVLSPSADSLTAPILGHRNRPTVRGAGLAAIRR